MLGKLMWTAVMVADRVLVFVHASLIKLDKKAKELHKPGSDSGKSA